MDTEQRIEADFVLAVRLDDHPDRNVDMRVALVEGAIAQVLDTLKQVCPDGRELSVAKTHLETAGLWALAAIARDPTSNGTGQPNA